MVFNATFNNISAISWRSVLLVEETRENHPPVYISYYITNLKDYFLLLHNLNWLKIC